MKTVALIERNKDGIYTIFTPDINHTILGSGKTVLEAKNDFENSVCEMIAAYTESNQNLPAELRNLTFNFKYDLASFFDYYSFINISKFAQYAGINQSLMRQYKMGQYISEKQMAKIESSLHRIGNELAAIKII